MSFGNIVGQLLQQGLAGQTQTRDRLQRTASQPAGGMEQMLGALLGGGGAGGQRKAPGGTLGDLLGGSSGGGGLADLAGLAQQFLGGRQVGGMTGAQAGGLGALVGAVLGGGSGAAKGAVGGGAMAILGTLALTALKNYQAGGGAGGGVAPAAAAPHGAPPVAPEEVEAVTDPATERLILRAMIAAAKADGHIDRQEMQRLVGQLDPDGVSDAERQFVIEEMTKPLDMQSIVAEVKSPAVAAEVYAASILAIDIDSEEERRYLRELARALRLDAGTVQRLHELTGAPSV